MKRLTIFWLILFWTQAAWAGPVRLDAALSKPILAAGQKQTVFLKVGLTGVKPDKPGSRIPANIAIVLDRSGSMAGEKLDAARGAAIDAIRRLSRDDIVSVVTYDDTVEVLVPATRLTDPESVIAKVRQIGWGNTTALFAGVSKGSEELHKFMARDRVSRMVLLSDGLANVGPSSPSDLQELGTSLGREGIGVTTIGLGLDYNEDLMAKLAAASNGRHYFVREPAELARAFDKEFGDVMTIVAQEVRLEIKCADGVRPVRVLGRGGDVRGQSVRLDFNQLYSDFERSAAIELEVPAGEARQAREVASVSVDFSNMQTRAREKLSNSVGVRFTDSAAEADRSENRDVMILVVEQIGAEQNMMATELRDKGEIDKARQLLLSNSGYLYDNSVRYNSELLNQQYLSNKSDAANLSPEQWRAQRKKMQQAHGWYTIK